MVDKRVLIVISTLIYSSVSTSSETIRDMTVDCEGETKTYIGDSLKKQTSFYATLVIREDFVQMIPGDKPGFSSRYDKSNELTIPGRVAFTSEKGNLFMFKNSGKFEIRKYTIISEILKSKEVITSGSCKPHEENNVFN